MITYLLLCYMHSVLWPQWNVANETSNVLFGSGYVAKGRYS